MNREIVNKIEDLANLHKIEIILALEVGPKALNISALNSNQEVLYIYLSKNPVKIDDVLFNNSVFVGYSYHEVDNMINDNDYELIDKLRSQLIYFKTDKSDELLNRVINDLNVNLRVKFYLNKLKKIKETYLKYDEARLKHYFFGCYYALSALWLIDNNQMPPLDFNKLVNSYLPTNLETEVKDLYEVLITSKDNIFINKNHKLLKFINNTISDLNNYLLNLN